MNIGSYVLLKFGDTVDKYRLVHMYCHNRAYVFERIEDNMIRVVSHEKLSKFLVKSPLLEALWGR